MRSRRISPKSCAGRGKQRWALQVSSWPLLICLLIYFFNLLQTLNPFYITQSFWEHPRLIRAVTSQIILPLQERKFSFWGQWKWPKWRSQSYYANFKNTQSFLENAHAIIQERGLLNKIEKNLGHWISKKGGQKHIRIHKICPWEIFIGVILSLMRINWAKMEDWLLKLLTSNRI